MPARAYSLRSLEDRIYLESPLNDDASTERSDIPRDKMGHRVPEAAWTEYRPQN